jgi:Ser/Thr protein kinase RdoA (MazF antagonist)
MTKKGLKTSRGVAVRRLAGIEAYRAINRLCAQRNGALQHLLFATHHYYVMLRIDQGRKKRPPKCGAKGTLL